MWVIVKMMKHHTGVELPVILVDSYSEIMSFETETSQTKGGSLANILTNLHTRMPSSALCIVNFI